MKITRQALGGRGRFRAAVHAVITILRMRFLVRRWRSGKRAVATASKPWSSAFSAPSFYQPGPVEHGTNTSPARPRPDTLGFTTPRSGRVDSPRGLRRASSLRETTSSRSEREAASLGRSVDSPRSLSSASSIFHPPVITGRTPPTRDTGRRRGHRGSESGAAQQQLAARSLDVEFTTGHSMSAPVHPDIQAGNCQLSS